MTAFAQEFDNTVLSTRLQKELLNSEQEYLNINILLADRIDARALHEKFIRNNTSLKDRSFELLNSLQDKANSTQASLLNFLQSSPKVIKHRTKAYWITNIIFAQVHRSVIASLSQRSDVAWLDLSGELAMSDYEEVDAPTITTSLVPNGIEPGLAAINAPAMWAMGYTGYGTKALILDTGTDPTHPALQTQFQFNTSPKEEVWFDIRPSNPNDCRSHGTHVCGTVMGIDRLNHDTIGVAFNAQWTASPMISCYLQDTNMTSTERLIGAFQWSLDPDNDPTTITDMPHAINNSWYDPFIVGEDCESMYVPMFNALEAAGVAVVFSAGNEGPMPLTITPPHNINTDLVNSFTVAALNANVPNLPIADFSSHGPSICGGEGSLLIKPEVAAPGESVRSCVPGGEYSFFSGTSMACPHTVGAILLLKEAFPELSGTELKLSLYFTAVDLGEPGEDNTYGMGMIDVLAAYNYLIDQGHTPVPPTAKEHDLILVNLEQATLSCNESVNPTIIVENGGENELTSFVVNYALIGDETHEMSYTWEGSLAPKARTNIQLASISATKGEYDLSVTLVAANDDRPLNNTIKRDIKIRSEDYVSAYVDLEDTPVCNNADLFIRSDYEGEGTVVWYTEAVGGMLIEEGNQLLLQNLTSNSNVYADILFNKNLGLDDKEEGDNEIMIIEETRGLVFDAITPFILKSVMIYAEQPGARFVSILNEFGQSIFDRTVIIPDIGLQQIEIDYQISEGENYQLVLQGGGRPLYYNTSGTQFPYEIDNVLTIKSSNNPDVPNNYYYFYDWEIEHYQFCGRTAIDVEVLSGAHELDADFSILDSTVDLNVNPVAEFYDNSTDAIAWFWNFGDGNTSTLTNPTHEYSNTGIYNVSLTVTNEEGCTDVFERLIGVIETTPTAVHDIDIDLENLQLFPNPTQNQLTISFDFLKTRNVNIQLIDLLGRQLMQLEKQNISNQRIELNLENYNNGIYYLLFEVEGKQLARKFMILK